MDFVQLPISFLDSDTDVNFSKSAQWVPAPPCLFEGGYYPIFYPIGTGMVGKKKIRTQIWYGNDYVIPAPEYPYPPQTWTRGCCQPACQASPCKAVRAVDKEMSYNWKEKFIGDRAEREGLGSGFGKQKRTKTEVIFNAQKLIEMCKNWSWNMSYQKNKYTTTTFEERSVWIWTFIGQSKGWGGVAQPSSSTREYAPPLALTIKFTGIFTWSVLLLTRKAYQLCVHVDQTFHIDAYIDHQFM